MAEETNSELKVAGKTPATASDRLSDAVREIVREALLQAPAGAPDEKKKAETPKPGDVLFLLLLLFNISLLIFALPDSIRGDPRLDLAMKLLPPVAGGLFVLFTSWYRERVLSWSRRKVFRGSQVVFPVLVVALFWLPIVPVRVAVEPKEALLFVGTEAKERNHTARIWTSLRPHLFTIRNSEGENINERVFLLRRRQLLGALWREETFRWVLHYPVHIDSETKGITLRLELQGASFDEDFLDSKSLAGHFLKREGDHTIIFTMPPKDNAAGTRLLLGEYKVTASKLGCQPQSLPNLKVLPDGFTFKFTLSVPELTCP